MSARDRAQKREAARARELAKLCEERKKTPNELMLEAYVAGKAPQSHTKRAASQANERISPAPARGSR